MTVDVSAAHVRPNGAPSENAGTERWPQIPWEVRWLPLDILVPDAAYQRKFQPAIARRLQERYIEELLAGVRVSLRDGVHYVKDGWHRVEAARALGLREIHCYVEQQTQAEEARDFVRLNSGTKAQSLQRFAGIIAAGDDPDALAVRDLIEQCGFTIDYEGRHQHDPRSFWAVDTALKLYRARPGRRRGSTEVPGPERLRRTLELARATWPDHRGAGQSAVLRAIDRLLIGDLFGPRGFERADWVRKVGTLDPDEISVTAHRYNRAHGRDTYLWVLQECVKAYNKGLRDPERRIALPIPIQARFGAALEGLAAAEGGDESAWEEQE